MNKLLSSESLSGDEGDLQGKDLFRSLDFQSQMNECSLKSHDPDKDITEDLMNSFPIPWEYFPSNQFCEANGAYVLSTEHQGCIEE